MIYEDEFEFEDEYNSLDEGATNLTLEEYDHERCVDEYGLNDDDFGY